jgi:tight adherence protein B
MIYLYGTHSMKKFIILVFKVAVCILGFFYFAGFGFSFGLIASLFLSIPVSKFLLKRLFDKKIALFLDNFVYAMDIIVRGTRTGLAVHDCFKQIVKDTNIVVGEQFLAINSDFKIGMSMEQAMERFMVRMPLKEVQFFCLSLIIQSKTGGNLSDIIEGLGKLLRGRKSLLVKIQTLSSEAKSSAIIMSCMPFALLGLLTLMSPDFVQPFFNTMIGKIVLLGCVIWMGIGGLIMRQMINFYK